MDLQKYRASLLKRQLDLLDAVETDTLTRVQYLVNCNQNLEQNEQFTYTLLVAALKRQHKSITKFLIKKGWPVKLSQKTGSYCTPLYYAVKLGDQKIFRALWKKGASLWDKDANEESALELAMLKNEFDIIDFVLNEISHLKKSKILQSDCESDVALFHAACWYGHSRAIEIFISHNFSVRSRSSFVRVQWKGFTPLHFVLVGKNPYADKAGSTLVEHDDIDFYAKDERGRTCINLAFRKHLVYLYRKNSLIDRIRNSNGGQPINSEDQNGLSHFHIFCSMKILQGGSENHISLLKYFIGSGVDVNSSVSMEDNDFPGFTALHFATQSSSWEVLKLLLENGADPRRMEKIGYTPLHWVLTAYMDPGLENRPELIKLLLHYGADPDAKDVHGRTPLHMSFRLHFDVCPLNESEKLLLSKNQQSINHSDKNGISYLHIACTGDDLGIVEALVMNGASINSCIPSQGALHADYSPLHCAVEAQQIKVVEFLLAHGADPNCGASDAKLTPLHLACRHSDGRYHEFDSQNDSNFDGVDWSHKRNHHTQIIELLIKYGASVNVEDSTGRTPLLENCSIPQIVYSPRIFKNKEVSESLLSEIFIRQRRVMSILLRCGADINACSEYGGTILHILIRNVWKCPLNRDLMKISLEKGANVNAADKNKKITPLHLAVKISMAEKLDMSLINFLLEHGADINGKSKNLETPLHVAIACYYSGAAHEDIIENLLNHPKIDLHAQNDRGQTPLHAATYSPNFFLIKKLLDFGPNVNVEDNIGNSPFYGFWVNLKGCGEYWRDENNLNILRAIVTHIKKLMRLNFSVSQNVQFYLEEFSEYLSKDDLALIDFQIDEEIKNLKSVKMDQYTLLYDMLFKGPHSLAKYAQNENLLEAIASIRSGQNFVIFGDIINRQYVKGCRRLTVLEPAKIALNFVTKVNWPYCCSDRILSKLSDDELRNLMKFGCAEETCKRSLVGSSMHEEPVPKISRIN